MAAATALVTGARGFAGRHLVAELLAATDWNVVGVISRGAVAHEDRYREVACDLRDAERVRRVVEHVLPSFVFHLAAQSYVPKAFASPADTLVNNVVAQVHLLEACRTLDIDPVVLVVGSSEEYGAVRAEDLPVREEQPLRPANPYAVSKATQDLLGLQYHLAWGMRVVRVRPFNHIGPGQSDRFVVASFARQVAEAERGLVEPVVLTGNLEARRDFLDVRDVVRAYRLVVEQGEPGEVYNIASGTARGIGDLLEVLVAMARVPLEVRQDPARMRPSDVPVIVGDAARLRERTGWQPAVPLEQTLADTLAWWREQVTQAPGHGLLGP